MSPCPQCSMGFPYPELRFSGYDGKEHGILICPVCKQEWAIVDGKVVLHIPPKAEEAKKDKPNLPKLWQPNKKP